jgi:hypothetical protein
MSVQELVYVAEQPVTQVVPAEEAPPRVNLLKPWDDPELARPLVNLSKEPPAYDFGQLPAQADRQQRLGRFAVWTGRAVLAAALVTGAAAAAETAIFTAPPDHIHTSILSDPSNPEAGTLNIDVKLKRDQSVTAIYGGIAEVFRPQSYNIAGLDIAPDIHINSSQFSFASKDGSIDYGKFLSFGTSLAAYQPEIKHIGNEVKSYYQNRAAIAALLAVGLELGVYGLAKAGHRHYNEQDKATQAALRKQLRYVAVGAAIIAGLTGAEFANIYDFNAPRAPSRTEVLATADHFLDQFPEWRGTAIKGDLLSLAIDKGVPYLRKVFTQYDQFKRNAVANYAAESQALYGQDTLPKAPGAVRKVLLDDLSGRFVMGYVGGHIVRVSGADYVVVSGDVSFGGSDDATIKNIVGQAGGHAKRIAVISEHDTPKTRQQEKDAGFTVAGGKTGIRFVKVGNETFLLGDLPLRAPLGGTGSYEINQGIPKFTQQMIYAMCHDHPQNIVVHDQQIRHAMIDADFA